MVAAVFIFPYKNCLPPAYCLPPSRHALRWTRPPAASRLLPAASHHLPGPDTGVGAGILFGSFT